MAEQPVLGFAGLLRQLRVQARLTQEELASTAGVSPRSASDLERGINRTARKETAELLAGALNLAEPVRALFVATARGRAPAAEVLAAAQALALSPEEAGPGTSPGPAGAGPAWSGCPYLGLVSFQEDQAQVFYGRGELTTQLLRRLDGTGILLLTGESGAGKSSLLRAGVMPLLAAGALGPGSQSWPRLVIRPTSTPLRELAVQLADLSGAEPDSMYRSLSAAPSEAPMLTELAVRTATALTAATATAPEAAAPRLVLVVDQLEELFTAGQDGAVGQAEREAFIAVLQALATVPAGPRKLPPALVVAAVRADFLGRIITYPPLKSALERGPVTVGRMSEAELRLAITGPAAEAGGLTVELALVEAVVAELREGPENGPASGALPLISQAMAATWEHREGSELTLRAYRRAGGVADAVNRSVQAAYDILTARQKGAARLVFTQLTVITPEGQFARRRCSRSELHSPGPKMAADINAVIDSFSARRLLVLGTDSVEISHDVLLHAWRQFRDWLGDDQLDRALYSQLATDARTWDINRRDTSYLYRPGRLATTDAAAARWRRSPTRYPPLAATSEEFLRAAHRATSRGMRRRRGVFAGLAALALIVVSAAGVAAHDAVSAARQQAIAESEQLVAESLSIAPYEPWIARRLAVAAWSVSPTPLAMSVMTTLLSEQQQSGTLPGDPANQGVRAVAFSSAGNLLASAYGDGSVRVWDLRTGQVTGAELPAAGPGDDVTGLAFSPDGRRLATADAGGTVRLWELATARALGTLQAGGAATGSVTAVAWSPSGQRLATADAGGTVRLWDPASGRAIGRPEQARPGPPSGVTGVAFSTDGDLLASAGADGTVRMWDPVTGQAPRAPLQADDDTIGGVGAVAFSPDGRLLASAGADGRVRLWDPVLGREVRVLVADTEPPLSTETGPLAGVREQVSPDVRALAFSADGTLLASANADGTVRLWDPATGRPAGAALLGVTSPDPGVIGVAFGPDSELASVGGVVQLWDAVTGLPANSSVPEPLSAVNGVAFSPDGQLLAAADADGTVRVWHRATGEPASAAMLADRGSGGGVNAVAFSPDGQLLASADADGTVRLWDPSTGQAEGPALPADTGPEGGVNAVAFSPDGQLLASADADGTVRLWDPSTGQPVGAALPVDNGQSVTSVAFSPDGQLLAAGDGDGYVRTWQISPFTHPYAALCADVGPPTRAQWLQNAPDEPEPAVCG